MTAIRQIQNSCLSFHQLDRKRYAGTILCIAFLLYFTNASALSYYSRISGNWNEKKTWSTVSYGNGANYGSYPKQGDFVYIKDGHTITITEDAACLELNIGAGVSGILQFGNNGNCTLNIYGSLKINPHAIFQYVANTGLMHVLIINGDFINNGDVRFRQGKNDYVSIIFRGDRSCYIYGKGTWSSLAYIVIDKNSKTDEVYVYSNGFGNALTAGAKIIEKPYPPGLNPPVIFIKGTLNYNIPDDLGNLIDPGSSADPHFTISPDVIIRIEKGVIDLATYPGIKNSGDCRLQGELIVCGGTVTVSKDAKSDVAVGLHYSGAIPAPKLTVSGGNIDCYGAFSPADNGMDNIDFKMTGGIFTVNMGKTAAKYEPFKISDNKGSSVDFSGGTIVIQNKSASENNANYSDFDLGGSGTGHYNVSGTAAVQFGNESTPSNQTMSFTAYKDVVYPNMIISCRNAAKKVILRPKNDADFKFMSLTINEKQCFDMRDGTNSRDDHVMTLIADNDSYTFMNHGTFLCRNSTVKLTGNSVQTIGGNTTTFSNLYFDSESVLANDVVVSNILTVNANVNLNSNNLILGISANNPGTLLSKLGQIHGGTFKHWTGIEVAEDLKDDQ